MTDTCGKLEPEVVVNPIYKTILYIMPRIRVYTSESMYNGR
jgi:hypothetical protein